MAKRNNVPLITSVLLLGLVIGYFIATGVAGSLKDDHLDRVNTWVDAYMSYQVENSKEALTDQGVNWVENDGWMALSDEASAKKLRTLLQNQLTRWNQILRVSIDVVATSSVPMAKSVPTHDGKTVHYVEVLMGRPRMGDEKASFLLRNAKTGGWVRAQVPWGPLDVIQAWQYLYHPNGKPCAKINLFITADVRPERWEDFPLKK